MNDKEYFFEHYPLDYSFDVNLPNTPGYCVQTVDMQYLNGLGVTTDTELIFEIENPYPLLRSNLSDSLNITLLRGGSGNNDNRHLFLLLRCGGFLFACLSLLFRCLALLSLPSGGSLLLLKLPCGFSLRFTLLGGSSLRFAFFSG